ncbi:MAG TPA: hypothetical protein PLH57_06560 [Oligoflexia bacterium]|nr:hypothetical protein [Oligoflexia bacterium]
MNSKKLEPGTQNQNEEMIRVNGKGQVIDMLRSADAQFRETILRGIEKRDPKLARELRRELAS